MADATLIQFVKEALHAGASRAETEQALLNAGWARDQVNAALDTFARVDFVVPVPVPRIQLSARDTFLYLVMFAMLYLSAYNLGNLLAQFVELAFPDEAFEPYGNYQNSEIRFSTAALLIAFPVFLFVAALINKQIRVTPIRRLSGIRKWLTWLTLAIAACIIVGDLIYLLNSLLSGELTTRFILKALIVGLIAGAIFIYYLAEMRKDDEVLAP
ncbi:MAG: DUF5671 domain-containing protein [Pseudomonadota bacterium]